MMLSTTLHKQDTEAISSKKTTQNLIWIKDCMIMFDLSETSPFTLQCHIQCHIFPKKIRIVYLV